jgi:hypothetical protein
MAGWDDVPVNPAPSLTDHLLALTPGGAFVQNPVQGGVLAPRVELLGGGANSATSSASVTIPVVAGAKIAIIAAYGGQDSVDAATPLGSMTISVNGTVVDTQPVRRAVSGLTSDADHNVIALFELPAGTWLYVHTASGAGNLTISVSAPNGPTRVAAFPLLSS